MSRRLFEVCVFLSLLLGPAVTGSITVAEQPEVDFAHDVVPILEARCAECHGGEEAKGGFSINTRALVLDGGAAAPGDSQQSLLIERVTSPDEDYRMPPADRDGLPAEEVEVLRRWIDQGLNWQEGYTFAEQRYEPPLEPRRPELPPAVEGRTNPVDRILDAYLAEHSVPRPEPLEDEGFLRRLHLDVLGLLPTPERRREFLADERPDKRARLVSEVLADRQAYAEHWLTFWNDLLRNAYAGTGYIDNGRKQITRWLYGSLLENRPYDEFVRELIAPEPQAEGFIQGIKWRGNVNASQKREIQFAQNVTQVFLGINMKCASCHDSFIDRWTLDETYGLAAAYSTRSLEIYRCDKPTGRTAQAAWIFPELGQVDPEAPQPERLEQLASLMTHPDNGRLTRTIVNRLWHRLMGRGIVHPVDAMHTEPWCSELLDYLAVHLADNGYDLKKTIELIVTSQAYQSRAVALQQQPETGSFVYSGPLAKRMSAEQFLDAVWSITDTWPDADPQAFEKDGRRQGGQLAAILRATQQAELTDGSPEELRAQWGERPVRASLTPLNRLQASLGRPNREQVVTMRPALFTTLEAIHLANDQELADTLRRGAQRLRAERPAAPDERIEWLYQYALSRDPTSEERQVARELLGSPPTSQGLEDLLWAVLMLPEFQLIR